jgi:hypothetical protein
MNPMAALLEGVEEAVAVVPEGAVPEAEVEPERLASSRKAAKLLGPDSTALIANTMPWAQCPVWPQYPQIGAV